MNRFARIVLGTLALTAPFGVPALADPIALGAAAPMADLKMKSADGKPVSIADVAGKNGTLVVFTCNACPWVKKWEARIVSVGNKFAKKGVGVIAINSNDPSVNAEDGYDVMVKRAKERKMNFPYVVDETSDLARAFGATRTPEAFLFDKDGKLAYHGAIDDNGDDAAKVEKAYLKSALDSVLSESDVAVKETKSIGCSIKFRS